MHLNSAKESRSTERPDMLSLKKGPNLAFKASKQASKGKTDKHPGTY